MEQTFTLEQATGAWAPFLATGAWAPTDACSTSKLMLTTGNCGTELFIELPDGELSLPCFYRWEEPDELVAAGLNCIGGQAWWTQLYFSADSELGKAVVARGLVVTSFDTDAEVEFADEDDVSFSDLDLELLPDDGGVLARLPAKWGNENVRWGWCLEEDEQKPRVAVCFAKWEFSDDEPEHRLLVGDDGAGTYLTIREETALGAAIVARGLVRAREPALADAAE